MECLFVVEGEREERKESGEWGKCNRSNQLMC